MTEENPVQEEPKEEAPKVEEKVEQTEKPASESKEQPKQEDSSNLKNAIAEVLDDLLAAEQESEPKEKVPSSDDFKKAMSDIASKIEESVRSEYDAKLDEKFKELNEQLESLSANRRAPREGSQNPFSQEKSDARALYEKKKSMLESLGFNVSE